MKMIGVRFEDRQLAAMEAISRRDGASLSDVVRELVDHGLAAAPNPAPKPPPAEPGQGPAGAAALPSALANQEAELRRDLVRLRLYRAVLGLEYWGPKVLAVAAAMVPFKTGDLKAQSNALSVVMLLILIDALWPRRVIRRSVLARAAPELEDLIAAVPGLWDEACRTKSPALAEAEVLAEVAERRRRLGELCLKDLGLRFWNPG